MKMLPKRFPFFNSYTNWFAVFLVLGFFVAVSRSQFILCFSFQWIPELRHYAPGVPIILVGTKLGKIFYHLILLCSVMVVVVSGLAL